LGGGSTVPFIARYRKEATGELDDIQLRILDEHLHYLWELDHRRAVIVSSIEEQDETTDGLSINLDSADSKAQLEDLYLPYKPKRRTEAINYLCLDVDEDTKIPDTDAALEGAKQILVELFAENAELVGSLRELIWENANLVSKAAEGKENDGAKFKDYFDYSEPVIKVPPHRA
jgi:uncharacterized protein